MTLFQSLDQEVDESFTDVAGGRQILGPTGFSLHSSTAYGTRAPLAPTGSSRPGFREFPAVVIFRSEAIHHANGTKPTKPTKPKKKQETEKERTCRERRTNEQLIEVTMGSPRAAHRRSWRPQALGAQRPA
jgi:hypothetical protein